MAHSSIGGRDFAGDVTVRGVLACSDYQDRSGNALSIANVTAGNAPAAANSTGTAGAIAWDTGFIYVCTATDTWKRVAIATWP